MTYTSLVTNTTPVTLRAKLRGIPLIKFLSNSSRFSSPPFGNERGAAFLFRARGGHNKMHSCQVGRERRRTLRGSIQVPESWYTCRVINISRADPGPQSFPLARSFSSPLSSLWFSFFYALESRPEVYNLAREVWGHDATRQSAYAYTPMDEVEFCKKERTKNVCWLV